MECGIDQTCKRILRHNYSLMMACSAILTICGISFTTVTVFSALAEVTAFIHWLPAIGAAALFSAACGGCTIFLFLRWCRLEHTKLGRALRAYEPGDKPMSDIMDQVDSDMAQSGQQFGAIYISDGWVIGCAGFLKTTAIRADSIRAIFCLLPQSGKQSDPEYQLYIYDENDRRVYFTFRHKANLSAAFDHLCRRFPDAYTGGYEERLAFDTYTTERRMEFYHIYKLRQEFQRTK